MLWSAYDKLDVQILNPETGDPVLALPVSEKNYSNTLAFRFGGQYHACDWFTARMGMYVDESPVSSDYLNPETPSMTKLAYTAGATFRPAKWMDIDIAYGYVNSADPSARAPIPTSIRCWASSTRSFRPPGFPPRSSPVPSRTSRATTRPGRTPSRSD